MGNRTGEGAAYGNLGSVYHSQGDISKAIEYLTQRLTIAKEEGRAYANLGACHMRVGEYVKAVACHKAEHSIGTELGLARMQAQTALHMGVNLRLRVQADRQGLLLAPPKLRDQIVTRRHQCDAVWMIKCVKRQIGSTLLSMVVFNLHDCSWRTSPGREYEAGQEDALAHLKVQLSCAIGT